MTTKLEPTRKSRKLLWTDERISSEALEATDELDGDMYVRHVISQLLVKMRNDYEARLRAIEDDRKATGVEIIAPEIEGSIRDMCNDWAQSDYENDAERADAVLAWLDDVNRLEAEIDQASQAYAALQQETPAP